MLHAIGMGAALAISSRLLSGEVRLSEPARERIEDLKESFESVSEITGGFQPGRPATWFGVGARLLEKVLDQRRWETENEWCQDHGFNVAETRQFRLWNELIWSLPREIVYRFQKSQLYRIKLPNGSAFVYSGSLQERDDSSFGSVLLPDDFRAREAVYIGIREFFWSRRNAVLLDVIDSNETISEVELSETPYLGDLELIMELKRFRAQGLRRNVLFQGRPGTGKSTLCREAARRLSSRTIILSSGYLEHVAASDWQLLLHMLDPEMVIVDDIDRISYNLESKLTLFEEGYCNVPYILMTSNELERMPQAMRRPGRIDMIFQLDDPEPWVLDEVIQGLAAREAVDIPEGQLEKLRSIAEETSTAHVVEVLRRAKVQGWGKELRGDITYSDGFCAQEQTSMSDRDFTAGLIELGKMRRQQKS